MKAPIPLHEEAALFSKYLIGHAPSQAHTTLYERGVSKLASSASSGTYFTVLRHPSLLPYLDAYDAFFRPASPLRQRLYLMFAILEASPDHTELFLPQKRSLWYLLMILAHGARGVYRLIVGTILVKVGGR